MTRVRWVVAGQLGEQFDDGGRMLLVEARSAFARAPMHRRKAHLYLSAMRHRKAELGDRLEYVRADTFREALAGRDLEVIDPTSYRARRLARELGAEILPSRGFVTSEADFAGFADAHEHAAMEDYYRWVRERTGILMEGDRPAGGAWNFDRDNRNPPPKNALTLGLPDPWWPTEDDIDAEVRRDLDRWERDGDVRFVGEDGPREFAVTPTEARAALQDFVDTRLGDFGPFEDAILRSDWTMAHSLLSVPMNLGVLDPREAVETVVAEYDAGRAPIASVEGFTRQIIGWREWVWHLYWRFGEDYVHSNELGARHPVPSSFLDLAPEAIEEACLSAAVEGVRDHGWTHHIQRLMVIGNHALQRGYDPREMNDWFVAMFVDGTPWVMPANVVGMTLHADGGRVATKPYAAGGAYINRMSDHCGGCRFDPKKRLGEDACPYTAGYWAFLDRVEPTLGKNHRLAQPFAGLRRLADRAAVVDQERRRDAEAGRA
ncbi:cryptochrome/photolyase family protein [Microbacterium sp. P02]|uniref:cryptochrome/photolyase family protein n=1 Tax=Microbacterium sp. P02 TaxID=3366260 RepID=UPI00366E9A2C